MFLHSEHLIIQKRYDSIYRRIIKLLAEILNHFKLLKASSHLKDFSRALYAKIICVGYFEQGLIVLQNKQIEFLDKYTVIDESLRHLIIKMTSFFILAFSGAFIK